MWFHWFRPLTIVGWASARTAEKVTVTFLKMKQPQPSHLQRMVRKRRLREWKWASSPLWHSHGLLYCNRNKIIKKTNLNGSAPESINEAGHLRGWVSFFFDLVYCRRRPEETMWWGKEMKQMKKLCRCSKEGARHTGDRWVWRQRGESKKSQSRRVGGWCAAATSNIVWFDSSDDKAPGSRLHVIPTQSGNYLLWRVNQIPSRHTVCENYQKFFCFTKMR